MKVIQLILLVLLMSFTTQFELFAQEEEDLIKLIETEEDQSFDKYVIATFKANRVINSHSVENVYKAALDFRIDHRFGRLSDGIYDLFGLDNANMRFSFDFGLTDAWTIGIGRSSAGKVYDGMTKLRFLRQGSNNTLSPVTMTGVVGIEINTLRYQDPARDDYFKGRLSYYSQLLIARKFTEGFSFQLMPTYLHKNLVETMAEKNDVFSLGIAGRLKISKRLALNFEYFLTDSKQLADGVTNPLSIGVDIETGGHVFQLHFTNNRFMTFTGLLTGSNDSWGDGDIFFGFNLSRTFNTKKKKSKT